MSWSSLPVSESRGISERLRNDRQSQKAILPTNDESNPVEIYFMITKFENKVVTKLEHVTCNLSIQTQRR